MLQSVVEEGYCCRFLVCYSVISFKHCTVKVTHTIFVQKHRRAAEQNYFNYDGHILIHQGSLERQAGNEGK